MKKHGTRLVLIIIPMIILGAGACAAGGPGETATSTRTLPTITTSVPLQDQNPAQVDNSLLPVTPLTEMHTLGTPPEVDIDIYRLEVTGLVDNPLRLDYPALMDYPSVTAVSLLICPGYFADNPRWTGFMVAGLLEEAGVQAGASKVVFTAMDGWEVELPLDTVRQENVLLALQVDGVTLPLDHGYPLRLVLPGHYGDEWIRWVNRIEIQ